jgi:hypothetical protein
LYDRHFVKPGSTDRQKRHHATILKKQAKTNEQNGYTSQTMLIIVESPTKAKKIQSILKVKTMSTVGHFKDLPDSSMGVDLKTYEPTFVYHEKKKHLPKDLRAAARDEIVMLAGDLTARGMPSAAISTKR